MVRNLLAVLLLGAWIAASANAQVVLQNTFQPETTQSTSINGTVEQTLTINGNDITSKLEQHLLLQSKAARRDENGRLPIEHQFESMQVEITVAGETVMFDSANPDEKNEGSQIDLLLDGFRLSAKTPWTTIVGRNNRIEEFKGWENILDDVDEKSSDLHQGLFDADYQREVWNAELDRLSDKPVKPGDSWQRQSTVRFHAGQKMTFTTQYKYVGVVEQDGRKLDKIESKIEKVQYTLGDGTELPLQVMKSDLKVAASSGHFLFDRRRGRVAYSEQETNIKGEITFKLIKQDKTLPGKLDLTLKDDMTLLP